MTKTAVNAMVEMGTTREATIRRLREQRVRLHDEARELGRREGHQFVFGGRVGYPELQRVVSVGHKLGSVYADESEYRLWEALDGDLEAILRDTLRKQDLPEAPYVRAFLESVVEAWEDIKTEVEQ